MATVDPELNLLLIRDHADDWRRYKAAGACSLIVHVIGIAALLLFKGEPAQPRKPEREFKPLFTKLYIPPELTQKAPNLTPVKKEIVVPTIAPRPNVKVPAPAPVAKAAQQAPPPTPAPTPTQPPPKQIIIEAPPRIEAPTTIAPAPPLTQINPLQPVEKPKLALENAAPPPRPAPAKPSGSLMPPSTSVQDTIRELSRGSSRAGMSVGDIGTESSALGSGLNLPPSAGRPRSSLELKSDPMGVDFRPYLLQALAAVRRNWFAVYPEAARLGQRGQVVLQFAIVRQGNVAKVIYTTESGSRALDQAAVAAVSASNPLPPLPADFKGDRIILQMTFLYNMPR